MFSKACEYGIRATIHIAHQSRLERRISLKQITKAIDSPVAFTAKILQSLAKNSIIHSLKGPSGGYMIEAHSIRSTTLADIVEAIDGDQIYRGCGLGLKECNDSRPCPVHSKYKKIRNNLAEMLKTTTVEQLTIGMQTGSTYLKI